MSPHIPRSEKFRTEAARVRQEAEHMKTERLRKQLLEIAGTYENIASTIETIEKQQRLFSLRKPDMRANSSGARGEATVFPAAGLPQSSAGQRSISRSRS